MIFLLLACTGSKDSTPQDSDPIPSSYLVNWSTSPDAVAGAEVEFTLQVTDQDGNAIEDLQQEHQRMVHTIFISQDLTDFQHLHQEDFTDLTVENLKNATFSFPITLKKAGSYKLGFDYAHRNQYLHTEDWMEVSGEPLAGTPTPDTATTALIDDMELSLTWDLAPMAGFETSWVLTVKDTDGNPVTDITPWLGADAHAIVTDIDLTSIGHTHAWVPGMETAPPGHDMPHTYPGPILPFHYTFLNAGTYKMWIQFARDRDPSKVYTVPFWFTVSP